MNRVAPWVLIASAMVTCREGVGGPGDEGQACYPNDTCNAGLVCIKGLCTTPSGNDAAAPDAAHSDAASDATPVSDGTPGSDLTPDMPTGCTPDKPFCRDDKIRRCADDGQTSVLLVDCTLKASHQCAECPEGFVCQAPSMVVQSKSTGVLSFDLQSYPGACKEEPRVSATFNFASGPAGKMFHFSIGLPNDDNESVQLNQYFEMVSGKSYALRGSPMVIGVSYQTSGANCISNYSGPSIVEPPIPGTATVTYAGQEPGDTFSLSASGYVTCDMGKTWTPFSLNASGVLTR